MLVAAAIFSAVAITSILLILYPPRYARTIRWITILLPAFGWLIVLLVLMADILVRHSIGSRRDITKVKTAGSFWLWVLPTLIANEQEHGGHRDDDIMGHRR